MCGAGGPELSQIASVPKEVTLCGWGSPSLLISLSHSLPLSPPQTWLAFCGGAAGGGREYHWFLVLKEICQTKKASLFSRALPPQLSPACVADGALFVCEPRGEGPS